MKKCPYCAEEIQDDAIACRYCRRNLKERSIYDPVKKVIRDTKVEINSTKIKISGIIRSNKTKIKHGLIYIGIAIAILVVIGIWDIMQQDKQAMLMREEKVKKQIELRSKDREDEIYAKERIKVTVAGFERDYLSNGYVYLDIINSGNQDK